MFNFESKNEFSEALIHWYTVSALHLMSRTIQGACSAEGGTNFDYDQSWICAL
jgi:hypothetical protein